jgi:RNA polymerase subunit RPABC4/transcription elongation factor Spt4
MSDMCPICGEKLDSAITFKLMDFNICFDCNYVTEPKKYTGPAPDVVVPEDDYL